MVTLYVSLKKGKPHSTASCTSSPPTRMLRVVATKGNEAVSASVKQVVGGDGWKLIPLHGHTGPGPEIIQATVELIENNTEFGIYFQNKLRILRQLRYICT